MESLNDIVKPLFETALDMEADQRAVFLSQNCSDHAVRAAVENLLANHDTSGALLAEPAVAELSGTVEAHAPLLKSGTLLARRFKVTRFIAHGGMGELYEVEDLELHESLAIKTLRPEILKQPKAIERFKREVHLARKVTHPNVCRSFDLFRDQPEGKEEIVFVTMEFLKGESLADRMRWSGRMSLEESLPLIRQMASALETAHEAGIVHRDFKPGNVMLVDDAAGLRAVVTDFGLALRVTIPSENYSVNGASWEPVSTAGALYGTLAYMAPEQIEGRAATAASDVYALGLVIYEMVTGARAFSGETPMVAAAKRLIEPPPTPRLLNPTLNPVWERTILRCLEPDPSLRFATPQGIIDALAGNAQPQVRAGKDNRSQTSIAPWPQRGNRYVWSTAGIAAIAVIAALAVGYRYYRSHKEAHTTFPSTGASSSVTLRPAVAVLGFKNLSRKPDTEWLSIALSETLNTELALGEKLRTIPGENVARTKLALSLPDADSYGQDTLVRIRENMDTDIVVLGSYLDLGKESGGKVRIDLRAQDTRTGSTIAVVSEIGTEAQVLDLILRTGAEVREKLGGGAITPAVDVAVRTSAPSSPEVARLYSEALKRLWLFDSVGAKAVLEKVVAEEPAYPLGHDALAQAWLSLGYEEKAKEEAEKAFHFSGNLSREQRLLIEGHYREINHEWEKAIELYGALYNFFPDSLDYGVEVAKAEWLGGKGEEAMLTIQTLRNLPAPARHDPRIDLAESEDALTVGDFKRAQTAAAEAEKKGRALQAPLVVAAAQLIQCGTSERTAQYAQAVADCEDARQAYARTGDREKQGRALLSMGAALQDQGDFSRAQSARELASAIFEEIGDKVGQSGATNNMAIALSTKGDHLASAHTFEQALALAREIGSKPRMALIMGNIASEFRELGNLAEANATYRQAVSLNREAGNKDSEAWALKGLGVTLSLQGDLPGSEKALNEALDICHSIGAKRPCGFASSNMGDLLELEGKLDEAENEYKESVAIWNELGNQQDGAEARMSLAELLGEEGRPGESEALVRQTIPVFQKAKWKDDEAEANVVLARALFVQGKTDEAAQVMNSVSLEGIDDKELQFKFTLASALIRAASGMPEEQSAARKSMNAMLAETTRRGYKGYEFEARLTLGEIEMKSNEVEAGRRRLAVLEKEARSKGFALVAAKAATAART